MSASAVGLLLRVVSGGDAAVACDGAVEVPDSTARWPASGMLVPGGDDRDGEAGFDAPSGLGTAGVSGRVRTGCCLAVAGSSAPALGNATVRVCSMWCWIG
jgi:hypothetical protein